MLLPDKHIRVAESLLGIGSLILESLVIPKTVDDLWDDFRRPPADKELPVSISFENIILAIDFLFAIGAVTENQEGKLYRCV